ncbi:hypothetical protein GCM10008955_33190 [Deinococcus malanensis]|uniref:Uncharacterized protein n=1 Tax=Deinococcus malanensis TaxID=1706855 RepID=A0ABQ2F3P2_9DEIO|nr:hypothetical protein GCM10008955_33190 [Deinococcus malanensis]
MPVKFKLGGNKGMAVFAAGSPKFVTVPFSVTDPVAAIETTISAGSSGLTYDALSEQYTYAWKTGVAVYPAAPDDPERAALLLERRHQPHR